MAASFCLNFSLFIYFLFTERKTKLILSASLSLSRSLPFVPCGGASCCSLSAVVFFSIFLSSSRLCAPVFAPFTLPPPSQPRFVLSPHSVCLFNMFVSIFGECLMGRFLSFFFLVALTTHSFIKKFCLPKTFFFVSICFKSDSILVYFNLPLFVHLLFRLIFFPF